MKRKQLKQEEIKDGLRVYVPDLDVFGKVAEKETVVICEMPLPGFMYLINSSVRPLEVIEL